VVGYDWLPTRGHMSHTPSNGEMFFEMENLSFVLISSAYSFFFGCVTHRQITVVLSD
jgi:hypothetical protein